jgi:bifunctional autolysin
VTSAETSAKGSLWSHRAVSNHLGGTNHVDPHGYFEQWGYKYSDFVKLVKQKYNRLNKESEPAKPKITITSKLGQLNAAQAKVYGSVDKIAAKDGQAAGTKLMDQVYYIKSEATEGKDKYYLISNQSSAAKGTIGWVHEKDLKTYAHTGVDKEKKTLYINGKGKAYNHAWVGEKDLVHGDLASYKGEAFQVNLTEAVGNNTWYRGDLAGKQVWIHASYLDEIVESSTSRLGHLKSANAEISQETDSGSTSIAGSKYTKSVHYIKKQMTMNNKVYYLLSTSPSAEKGTIGWVEDKDLNSQPHISVDKKAKTFFIKGTGTAYDKAWGGSRDAVSNLSSHKGDVFEVHLTEKVGSTIWYRGKLDGETVWVEADDVTGFTDVSSSMAHHDAIYGLVELGAISGYSDNSYRPGKEITRSQTAVIFTGALNLSIPQDVEATLKNFSDISPSHDYAKQIAETHKAGIFRGSNGEFKDGPLNREQMATVIVQAFDLKDTGKNIDIRLDNVSESHKKNVEILQKFTLTIKFCVSQLVKFEIKLFLFN